MSDRPHPVVSVVTATRNRASALKTALSSIARQTVEDFEAIVVDDGSGAATLGTYPRLFADLGPRFVLVPPVAADVPGTGPSDALNRGIHVAKGEYIAFLDDDDEWLTADHLEVGLRSLREHGGDVFFANMRGHRDGHVTRPDWFADTPYLKDSPVQGGDVRLYEVSATQMARTLRHRVVHRNSMLLRGDVVREIGGFLKHGWMWEDWNFAFHAGDLSRRTLYRPDVVASYRFPSGDSVSLTVSTVYFQVQQLVCATEARMTCRRREFRDAARAMEAWIYRTWSEQHVERGLGREGLLLAGQAFATYPTLGGAAAIWRAALRSAFRRRTPGG